MLDDQRELIYNSSVRTQNVAWKTSQKRLMIETDGERESLVGWLFGFYDISTFVGYLTLNPFL